jgi:hypothetical protein
LQVAEVDLVRRRRRDDQDACRRAGDQPVVEQVRQQERRELVRGKHQFEAVGRDRSVPRIDAGAVDDDVEPREGIDHLGGKSTDVGRPRQVGLEDSARRSAGGGIDRRLHRAPASGVSGHDPRRHAGDGQRLPECASDPRGGAGDEGGSVPARLGRGHRCLT